jgi:flagellar assembly protein FliH
LRDTVELPALAVAAAPDERARAEGFAAGYAAGARRAAADAAQEAARVAAVAEADAHVRAEATRSALTALAAAADAVRSLTAPVLAEGTATLHRAALELAQAALGVELLDAEHGARAALARVLAAEPGPAPVRVRMHPADAALVRAAATALPEGLELEDDPTLGRGDAVAHHADGHVDARLSAAFDRARQALEQAQGH